VFGVGIMGPDECIAASRSEISVANPRARNQGRVSVSALRAFDVHRVASVPLLMALIGGTYCGAAIRAGGGSVAAGPRLRQVAGNWRDGGE